jgi:lactoylglutathione lyase
VSTAVKQAVPFFLVSDMEASRRFYVEGLGFEMLEKWIDDDGRLRWCWLAHGGAAVMLQEAPKDGAHAWEPAGHVGEGVSIYFICDDALAVFHDTRSRGIESVRTPFVGNGMWITSFADPDGYKLFFESATDVAEETEYSEAFA